MKYIFPTHVKPRTRTKYSTKEKEDFFAKLAKDGFKGETKNHEVFMSDAEKENLLNRQQETSISDNIYLAPDAIEKLMSIASIKSTGGVPADILFEGTVPLMDIIIVPTPPEDNQKFLEENQEIDSGGRITIFQDYKEIIKRISKDKDNTEDICDAIGVITIYMPNFAGEIVPNIIMPIYVEYGKDNLKWRADHEMWIYTKQSNKQVYSEKLLNICYDMGIAQIEQYIKTWYGIQISMLHPFTKTVFDRPKFRKLQGKEKKILPTDETGRTVKYIRYHHIEVDDFEADLHDSLEDNSDIKEETVKRSYTRKTLVWHVSGHWHTFRKNGENISKFINGYWKGPLKDYKRNLDNQNREIPM